MDTLIPYPKNHHSPSQTTLNEKKDLYLLKETFQAFLKNFSKNTALSYEVEVKRFLFYVAKTHSLRTARDLRRNHIIEYKSYLIETKGFSNKTVLRKLSSISSFCKFLASVDLVEKDIVYGVKRPTTENQTETADLSDKDVRKLFESMNSKEDVYTVHHRAILAVGFYTGLRSSEIRNLTLKSYAKLDGHMLLRCKIKNDKTHEIALNPFVVRCLDEHIESLKKLGFVLNPDHYLFPSIKTRQNKPIHAKSLWKIFQNRIQNAGIELSTVRRYSPHSMRATMAGHLLNTIEAPLADVQKALGHSSPNTTMKYNKREKSHDKSPVYKIDY